MHKAELKITIVYTYFLLLTWSVLCLDAVYVAEQDVLEEAITSYFLCEAVGHVPGRCSRETLEQYSHPLLNIAIYNILSFFVPIVNLLFVINCRSIRESIKKLRIVQTLRSVSSRTPQS